MTGDRLMRLAIFFYFTKCGWVYTLFTELNACAITRIHTYTKHTKLYIIQPWTIIKRFNRTTQFERKYFFEIHNNDEKKLLYNRKVDEKNKQAFVFIQCTRQTAQQNNIIATTRKMD